MTLKEAYKILGASKDDDDREIKSKYKKLLFLYHPDSAGAEKREPEDDEKIRLVIEAYKKIRESDGDSVYEPYEFSWDAFENKGAFSERNIYVRFRIYEDEELPLSKMARGKFIWDPDMEEFSLFAKSVLESCKEIMADYNAMPTPERLKGIFHLMMQEYVLSADAARKIGKMVRNYEDKETYSFNGYIKDVQAMRGDLSQRTDEPLNVYLQEDRAIAVEMVSGKILGSISFDEDELYYVVLPLLEDPKVESHVSIMKVDAGARGRKRVQVRVELTIPKRLTDTPVVNERLIRELLKMG